MHIKLAYLSDGSLIIDILLAVTIQAHLYEYPLELVLFRLPERMQVVPRYVHNRIKGTNKDRGLLRFRTETTV